MSMLPAILRLAYRIPLAILWTAIVHCFLRVRAIIGLGGWDKRRPGDAIGLWGAGLCWIMGLRVHKRNERVGPMGDLIVANHMGFLDIPALLSVFPAVFVIKMELRNMPLLGGGLGKQGHVFVDRGNRGSRRDAAKGAKEVLENGDRLIVFPEGRAMPGSRRLSFKPFLFSEAARQEKRVELCVLDYLPDRAALEWDIKKPQIPQMIKLFGRRRTDLSLEFFPAEIPADGPEMAKRYHAITEERLAAYDREREQGQGESSRMGEPVEV